VKENKVEEQRALLITFSGMIQGTGTPILIPISGKTDIGAENSDIRYFISDIRYNIWYNIGYPDIGVR
jgi:hypothetical protein